VIEVVWKVAVGNRRRRSTKRKGMWVVITRMAHHLWRIHGLIPHLLLLLKMMVVPLSVLGVVVRRVHDWCGRSRRRKVRQIRMSLVGALGFGLRTLGRSGDREGRGRRRGLVMRLRRREGAVG
jgi:hypothetical protein